MDAEWAIERLRELRFDMKNAERRLEALNAERADTIEQMLRISGGIQVLEELVSQSGAFAPDPALSED